MHIHHRQHSELQELQREFVPTGFTSGEAKRASLDEDQHVASYVNDSEAYAWLACRPSRHGCAVISMNNERNRANVLLVEDEAWIRELWTEELEDEDAGYCVIPVASARAALPLLTSGGLLGAAIIDIGLPEMSGEVLIQMARSVDPLLPIVAVTGFDAAEYRHLCDQGVPVLQKPFRTSWLLFHLRASLARRAATRRRGGLLRRAIC